MKKKRLFNKKRKIAVRLITLSFFLLAIFVIVVLGISNSKVSMRLFTKAAPGVNGNDCFILKTQSTTYDHPIDSTLTCFNISLTIENNEIKHKGKGGGIIVMTPPNNWVAVNGWNGKPFTYGPEWTNSHWPDSAVCLGKNEKKEMNYKVKIDACDDFGNYAEVNCHLEIKSDGTAVNCQDNYSLVPTLLPTGIPSTGIPTLSITPTITVVTPTVTSMPIVTPPVATLTPRPTIIPTSTTIPTPSIPVTVPWRLPGSCSFNAGSCDTTCSLGIMPYSCTKDGFSTRYSCCKTRPSTCIKKDTNEETICPNGYFDQCLEGASSTTLIPCAVHLYCGSTPSNHCQYQCTTMDNKTVLPCPNSII